MRPLSAGKFGAAAAGNNSRQQQKHGEQHNQGSCPCAGSARRLTPLVIPQISPAQNFTCGALRAVVGGKFGHRLGAAEKGRRPQHAGEGLQRRIVDPHRFDVVAPGDGDAVFGAFQLRLQGKEVLVRLQIRVILADREQAPQRPGKLGLRRLELLELIGIGEIGGIDLHLGRRGARLDHGGQDVLFLFGIALHRGDQIGDEVGTPLILVLHLRPFCLGGLGEGGNGIVTAHGNTQAENHDS